MKRMASKQNLKKNLISLAVAGAIAGISLTALAGGFQLFEINAVEIGLTGAGGAAIADDASTAYSNPAGMMRLKHPEIVTSADEILTRLKYTGVNTWSSSGFTFRSNGTVQGGGPNFVPAFHIVAPIPEYHMAIGFSIAAPFGLETVFPETAFTRYSATDSSILDIDFSPNVAFQLTKHFSIGFGLDPQYIKASFDSVAGLPGFSIISPAFSPTFADTTSKNEGSDMALGWHTGVLWDYGNTRFGLTYRSSTHVSLAGTSKFKGPLAAGLPAIFALKINPNAKEVSNNLSARLVLPATITFSIYHNMNNRWAVMGSIKNTQWHSIKTLTLNNVAGITPLSQGGKPTKNLSVSSHLNYHDSWRVAVGSQYQLTHKILLRCGVAYDESPTTLSGRSIRLPDEDRILVGIGAHYQATNKIGIDVGWNHFFIKDGHVSITNITGSQRSRDVGVSKNGADILGAQLTIKLA